MRALKVVGVAAIVVGALVAIVFLMGSALPREHVATAVVTINAPQGKVWSLMEDVEAQPRWRSGLKSVELLPNDLDGHRCWVETQRRMKMPLCEEATDAPITRVVAIADPTLGYGGSWTYNLTALTPDTTGVAIMEQGSVSSPFWRFLGHYVFHDDSNIKRYEEDLQRAAVGR